MGLCRLFSSFETKSCHYMTALHIIIYSFITHSLTKPLLNALFLQGILIRVKKIKMANSW